MMKRLLIGVLSITAGTALVLTSFACARLEGGGSVNGPPTQETPSAAFQGPSVAVAEIATTTPEPETRTGVDRSHGDRVLFMRNLLWRMGAEPPERDRLHRQRRRSCPGRDDRRRLVDLPARDRPVRGRPGRNDRTGPRRSDPGPEDRRLLRKPRRRPSVRTPECPILHSEQLKEAEIK